MKIIKAGIIIITIFISAFKSQAMIISQPDSDKYNLVISFISIGEGSDSKTKEKLDAYLAGKEKAGIKYTLDKFRWGREGEEDYCLKLDQLNEKPRMQMIEEIKKICANNKLVFIEGNAKSRHKR